jgi:hypothetical protein
MLQPQHLFDNFARRQVAFNAIQTAGAKDTPHCTAHLAADADASPGSITQQDAFDLASTIETYQQFIGPVTAGLDRSNLRAKNDEGLLQTLTQSRRQIGHLRERFGPSMVQPFLDLSGSKWFFPLLNQPLGQFVLGQRQKMPPPIAFGSD